MLASTFIRENGRPVPEIAGDDIQPAILIQISESRSAPGNRPGAAGVGPFESAFVIQREEWRLTVVQGGINLLDVIHYMALNYEKILPTVVVEIFPSHSPA
jgi:hypothetical protein